MEVHTTSQLWDCWRRCIQRECVAFLLPESSWPAGLAATAYWMARRSLSDLVLCRLPTSCRHHRETGGLVAASGNGIDCRAFFRYT